jgi:MATE family multidrug resistance protein
MTPFRRELRPMLHIAAPLALAELGWMSMGLVDTIMVGHLPNAAVPLSAAALAQVLYNTLAFGIGGVLLGLDTTISQAHGANDYPAANRWLWQGIILCTAISICLMAGYALMPIGLRHLPADRAIFENAIPTLEALSLGTLPLLLTFTLRRYLQAFNHVRIIAAALVSANLINLFFDWLLIFAHDWRWSLMGARLHLAWPAYGVVGSGIATSLARLYQAAFSIVAILILNRRNRYGLLASGVLQSLKPHWQSLRRLLALGAPAGATILVEIAIFAVVTSLIATLGPVALAGHEIALNCISFTFMVPLGISAAASVRVGQAIGRGSPAEARAAGWAAIFLGGTFMLFAAALFVGAPHAVASGFTHDLPVIAATVPLLYIAALFQFCDGLQVTAIGALRGAGDTHSGLITHLCSYWLLGLPLGTYLCFHQHLGARGLWLGLSAALIVTGITMLLRWRTLKIPRL